MPRGRKVGTVVETKATILDSFEFISQSDKNKFLKKAESLKISQEDLLNMAIQGLLEDWIPIEIETVTKVSVPKKK